jgi:hypothetical protein
MRHFAFQLSALVLLAVLPLVGCSKRGNLVKVDGIVYLDDQPLPDAQVMFIPIEAGEGSMSATGLTGSDGKFRLSTFSSNDGCAPGNYKVTVVVSTKSQGGGPEMKEGKIMDMTAMMQKQGGSTMMQGGSGGIDSSIPISYGDKEKTPLRQKVPADGTVELRLKKTGG